MSTASMREAAAAWHDAQAAKWKTSATLFGGTTTGYEAQLASDQHVQSARAIRALPDPAPQEDREVASAIMADLSAWLTQYVGPKEPLRLLHAEITAALASVREASRVEERAAVVAWLIEHQIVLAIDHTADELPGEIATAIERGDHLTPEKGDG